MNLKIKRKDLLHAARSAASVVKTNTTLPALSHLLVRPEAPNRIELLATNLEVQASHHCGGEIEAATDEGFCIPAKLFIEILSLSDAEDVHINHAYGRAAITMGARKLKIATMSAIEIPLFPDVKGESFEIAAEVLGTQLARVSFAISDDESRQTLRNIGVAFVENTLRFTACNGGRGAVTSIPYQGEGEFLLPDMLASIVENFCASSDSDVVVTRSENAASFKFKDAEIIGKLAEGIYPNFTNVIPVDRPHKCTLDRFAFISALKSIVPIQADGFKGVKFEFGPNAVRLSIENPINSGDEELPSSACSMEPIVLPSDNLLEALAHMTGDVVALELVDDFSPVVLQEPDYLNAIMPMLLTRKRKSI